MKKLLLCIMVFKLALTGICSFAEDKEQTQAQKDLKEWLKAWEGWSATKVSTTGEDGLPEQIDVRFDSLSGDDYTVFWFTPLWLWPHDFRPAWNFDTLFDRLQRMGTTSVVFSGGFLYNGVINWRLKLPRNYFCAPIPLRHSKRENKDFLLETAKQCEKRGMDLWIVVHNMSVIGGNNPEMLKAYEPYFARDEKGQLYKGPHGEKHGSPYDVFNNNVFDELICPLIDSLVKDLKPYGVFRGFIFDELGFNYFYNFMGAHLDKFRAYCEKEFGETLPADIGEKVMLKEKWHDPKDVWWRRFCLWRMKAIGDFEKRFVKYAHSKGLKVVGNTCPGEKGVHYAWREARDMSQVRAFDYDRGANGLHYTDNGAVITWAKPACITRAHAQLVCGKPIQVHTYWQIPASLPDYNAVLRKKHGEKYWTEHVGKPWRATEEFAILFRDIRRWSDAKSLCRSAVLVSSTGYFLRHIAPISVYKENEAVIQESLSEKRQVRKIYTELPEYFDRYPAIIAMNNSVRYMALSSFDALMKHVEAGGTVISLMTDWAVARADLTQEKKMTEPVVGVKYGEGVVCSELRFTYGSPVHAGLTLQFAGQNGRKAEVVGKDTRVIAMMKAGEDHLLPAITVNRIGKGRVIGIHFDLTALLRPRIDMERDDLYPGLLDDIIYAYAKESAPVRAEGSISIQETLEKGGNICITLLPVDMLPAAGIVSIDASVLKKRGKYTVTSRSRGIADPVLTRENKKVWRVGDLQRGIPVIISESRGYELLEIERAR